MYLGFLYTKGECYETNKAAILALGITKECDIENKNIKLLSLEAKGKSVPALNVKNYQVSLDASIQEVKTLNIEVHEPNNSLTIEAKETPTKTKSILVEKDTTGNTKILSQEVEHNIDISIESKISELSVVKEPSYSCVTNSSTHLTASVQEFASKLLITSSNNIRYSNSLITPKGYFKLNKGWNEITIPFVTDKNGNILTIKSLMNKVSAIVKKEPYELIEIAIRNVGDKEYTCLFTKEYQTDDNSENNFNFIDTINDTTQPASFRIYALQEVVVSFEEINNA